MALSSFLSGRLTGRVGPRFPMAIGLAAGGMGLLALVLVGATTAYPAIAAILHVALVVAGGGFLVGWAPTLLAVRCG